MAEPITWTTQTRRLGDLVPWEENPRQIRGAQADRLKDSLRKFGYSQLIEIEPDNEILDGHQRDLLMKLMEEYTPDTELEVRVASRKFTDQERKQYVIYKHKGAAGEFDWSRMENWSRQDLMDWGFEKDEIPGFHLPAAPAPPADFKEYNSEIETQYCCPKCGYQWSGKPK